METNLTPDLARTLINSYRDAHEDEFLVLEPVTDIARIVQHPHFKDVFAVITQATATGADAYIVEGPLTPERVTVIEAFDTFDTDNPRFLDVTIADDGTWSYPDDPNGDGETLVWRSYQEYDAVARDYKPTKFAPGERVFPLYFHDNVPGGWTVFNAERTHKEYFQAE